MNSITINTNIHCGSCVEKIKPFLDNQPQIQNWSVDTSDPNKPLTVKGTQLSVAIVESLVQSAGFQTHSNGGVCEMPTQAQNQTTIDFWKDKPIWKRASLNTLNCLVGCSIGDFGMIIFLQAFYPQTPMLMQMILAIIAGLVTSVIFEASLLKWLEGFAWKRAFQVAFSMSFISMVAMELVMNSTDFAITGGQADFGASTYWIAILLAMIAGFLAPLPYNYYKLKKYGKACH